MIMLAWLVIDSLRSIENVKRLANVFVIGTSLLAFTAIGQQLNNIFAERSLQSVSGTFDARNEMIFYLVPGFLIITSLARSANSQLAKLIFSVGVIVHYAAIFFSRGRAGMLIVTTCFLILLIITARKPKRALAWLCAACAFVVLSANIIVLPGKNSNLYMNKLVHRYSGSLFQEVEANRGSAAVRIDILKGLVDAWKSEPLSGIGIGTFKNRSHEFVKSKLVNNGIQPHNSYLGMLAEAGPFGLGGVLLLVSSGSLVLRRREGLTEHVRWLQSGIGVAFLGVAFNLLIFDGFLRYGFWLMIGLTLSLRRVLNDRSNGRGVTRVICDGIRF
jgi:O-antigen ligase